jgi:predicted alpha/beta superfamily hydrolase
MNKALCCFVIILVVSAFSIASSNIQKSTGTGEQENIVIGKRTKMYSEILGEWRPLEIYLPDDYENSNEPYPVMVVLDGDWRFNYLVSIVDMISPNYIPRMIVVGLPNTDRQRDLDPYRGGAPQAENDTEKFIRFLKQELFVHLGKKYRTWDYRILAGHSLAGYFTVYAFLKEPKLFDGYIASSPGFGIPKRLELVADLLEETPNDTLAGKYLYFSGGGNESEALHDGIRNLDNLLKIKENSGLKWAFDIFEGEGHVPIKGFYQGLMNLFSGWIPSLEFFINGDLEYIKNHYEGLTDRFGFRVLPPTPIMNSTGRRFLRNTESKKAIELYKYFISVYPNSSDGHLALAEAYEQDGQIDLAVQNLRKSLKLDPDSTQAQKFLDNLLKR